MHDELWACRCGWAGADDGWAEGSSEYEVCTREAIHSIKTHPRSTTRAESRCHRLILLLSHLVACLTMPVCPPRLVDGLSCTSSYSEWQNEVSPACRLQPHGLDTFFVGRPSASSSHPPTARCASSLPSDPHASLSCDCRFVGRTLVDISRAATAEISWDEHNK
jgi:hypothetical protein